MPRQNNFLLGHGERLTQRVDVPSGGGEKNPPYSFQAARTRIVTRMAAVATALRQLPEDAAPNGQVVAVMTMHPRYIAKSDFPSQLLDTLGLRAVGSRSRTVRPESWGIQKHPDAAVTEDIFVTGSRDRFSGWAREVSNWSSDHRGAEQLSHVEDVADFSAREKLRMIPTDRTEGVLEIVLHNAGDEAVVDAFIEYARRHGASPIADRRRNVKGLTFVPVRTEFALAEQLARFSFVRVARPIPTLRPLRPESYVRFGITPRTFRLRGLMTLHSGPSCSMVDCQTSRSQLSLRGSRTSSRPESVPRSENFKITGWLLQRHCSSDRSM